VIVEVSQFRLVPGTDEQAFLKAAEETQSGFLQQQPGFRSRELLRSDDGSWIDLVRFDSLDEARAAFEAFAGHPSAGAFEKMLDVSSVAVSHWSQTRSW
jgi:heme-degrading monooxygenase HmoA